MSLVVTDVHKKCTSVTAWSMGKLFAIFLWRTYTGKISQVLHPTYLKKKLLIDFHISNVFVSFTSCLLQSILKKKVWLSPETYLKKTTRKTRFLVLARPSYSILKKSARSFFVKLKLVKMNSWMSQLSNDTILPMLWTTFDFHIQVDLFMELPSNTSERFQCRSIEIWQRF